jgi:hypothetical protein
MVMFLPNDGIINAIRSILLCCLDCCFERWPAPKLPIRIMFQPSRLLRTVLALYLTMMASVCNAQVCAGNGDTIFGSGFELTSGTTHYVSSAGLDSQDGSYLSPWRTIQHTANSVNPGDTVCVRGGTYNEIVSITRSGSATGGAIVFQNYPGEVPSIVGTNLGVPNGQWGLITLQNVSFVEVRGFEIGYFTTGSTSAVPIGIYVTGAGTDLRIVRNHIHDISTTAAGCAANAFGLKVDGTSATASINQLTISRNELDHLVLGCSESLSLDGNVQNWSILDNTIHDSNNIGIGAIGFEGVSPDPSYDRVRDGVISGNTVYAITSFGNPAYGNQYSADGIYIDGGTRITIERNLVHHVDLGIEIASEHAGHTSSYVLARSNIVYSSNSAGMSIGGYDGTRGGTDHCTLINNTLLHDDSAGTHSGEFQIQYHATNNVFENNIVYANSQALLVNAFTGDTTTPANLDYNLYFADGGSGSATWVWNGVTYSGVAAYQSGSAQDANTHVLDPQFLSLTMPNLHLPAQSPAVDAGTNPGSAIIGTLDFAGQPRLKGAGVDIGAYEQ